MYKLSPSLAWSGCNLIFVKNAWPPLFKLCWNFFHVCNGIGMAPCQYNALLLLFVSSSEFYLMMISVGFICAIFFIRMWRTYTLAEFFFAQFYIPGICTKVSKKYCVCLRVADCRIIEKNIGKSNGTFLKGNFFTGMSAGCVWFSKKIINFIFGLHISPHRTIFVKSFLKLVISIFGFDPIFQSRTALYITYPWILKNN